MATLRKWGRLLWRLTPKGLCVASVLSLGGCIGGTALGPTPALDAGATLASAHPQRKNLLYVTDRAPVARPDGALAYGAERSRQMTFGTVDLDVVRTGSDDEIRVGEIRKHGEFPRTPYPMQARSGGLRRAPQAVLAHQQAIDGLQSEVAKRLAVSARKEVVVFIHGYNNSFEDSVRSTGNLCKSLGDGFVCVVLSWPAGGSSGILFGYNVDRESGEFAVADMRKAIRAIGQTKGLRKLHVMAHSRGTDVMTAALQQLGIECHVAGTSLSARLKVANIVLFAPDIDLDVAASRIFTVGSDPDLPVGRQPRPSAISRQGDIHLTVYSSPGDKALGVSGLLFGGIIRLGQLAKSQTDSRLPTEAPDLAGMIDFIEFRDSAALIGHDYFLSSPAVSSDIIALVRDGLKPGEPGRRLEEIKRPFWRIEQERRSTF